jgi:hypothetical protein
MKKISVLSLIVVGCMSMVVWSMNMQQYNKQHEEQVRLAQRVFLACLLNGHLVLRPTLQDLPLQDRQMAMQHNQDLIVHYAAQQGTKK